jgi:hypothetical protein
MNSNTIMTIFSGALNLGNIQGTLYHPHTQTGALTLAVATSPKPGGWAAVPIVANGGAINVPAAWIKYGGDDISIVAGQTNHLQVFYLNDDTVYYTNKVVAP